MKRTRSAECGVRSGLYWLTALGLLPLWLLWVAGVALATVGTWLADGCNAIGQAHDRWGRELNERGTGN